MCDNYREKKVIAERCFKSWLLQEFRIATCFGLVGIIATTVHMLIVWILLSDSKLPPLVSNFCAFFIAFGISFCGNYIWTFRMQGDLTRAIRRYLLISVAAFGLNTIVLACVLRIEVVPTGFAGILSAMIVPVFTFLSGRLWAFK